MPTSHLDQSAQSNGPAAGSASARERPPLRTRPLRRLVALALASGVIGAAIVTGLVYATGSAGNQGQVTTVQQLAAVSKGSNASASIDAAGIYSAAAPGVVDITASGIPSSSSGLPLIPQNQSETATGNGFEIDSRGDILTAEHVVADAPKIYNGHPPALPARTGPPEVRLGQRGMPRPFRASDSRHARQRGKG